jgi:cytochrome c oxidase assembly factor CtaG
MDAWSAAAGSVLAVSAAVYALAVRQDRRRAHATRRRRRQIAAFAAGWLTLVVAFVSPLHHLAGALLSIHMVQHLLLVTVAAPLLVLGSPLALGLAAVPPSIRGRVARWRRWPPVRMAERAARPAPAAVIFGMTLWGWHAPRLFQAALVHEWVHVVEHASLLGGAVLFWWALARRRRDGGVATLCLFVTTSHAALLGVLLTLAPMVWYPAQAPGNPWGLTALEDQQLAGLIMRVPYALAFVVAGLALFARWLREAERRVSQGRFGGPAPGPRSG